VIRTASPNPLAFNYTATGAPARLAVGVISYNRRALLESCLEHLRKNTPLPIDLIVADDGSTDGCVELLREQNVPVITGPNRGIAWNKNRALFALLEHSKADVILLLENDCYPAEPSWAETWLEAVALHGHINCLHPKTMAELATGKTPEAIIGGSGTPRDPYLCKRISGICIGSSRQALAKVGFLDTRFKGYGHEHAEWTTRFHNEGYGVHWYDDGSGRQKANLMIQGGLIGLDERSSSDKSTVNANYELFQRLKGEPNYRAPWRTPEEEQRLRGEVSASRPVLENAVPTNRRIALRND
jgi:glycosyltransferase involved in cell wall biosynthesis